MTRQKEIEKLIALFLNGETTTAEEQRLYDFFATDDVPKSLRKYQKMFRWYADGMKEPLPARPKRRTLLVRMAAAASVTALFGIGFSWYRHAEYEKQYAIYEDSYIVRDGKKITDLREIKPELERTSNEVADMLSGDFFEKTVNVHDLPVI